MGDLLVGVFHHNATTRRFCMYEATLSSVGVSIEPSVHYYMWLIGHVTSSRKKIAQLPMIERMSHPTGIHSFIRICTGRRKHHTKITHHRFLARTAAPLNRTEVNFVSDSERGGRKGYPALIRFLYWTALRIQPHTHQYIFLGHDDRTNS